MSTISTDRLERLVTEALERTAFVIADHVDSTEGLAPPTRAARVAYTGPSAGEVTLAASDGFVLELASSLLGVEPDEVTADGEGEAALRELANIVGGSVLIALGGEDAPYKLGLPEPCDSAVADDGVVARLESMGETLTVAWRPAA